MFRLVATFNLSFILLDCNWFISLSRSFQFIDRENVVISWMNPTQPNKSQLELITPHTEKKKDSPMRGQKNSKNQNKIAVSPNPEKDEGCKKMRKGRDKSSDSFIAWSPPAWKIATEKYLAERANGSPSIDKAPITPNTNDCPMQNELGRENDLDVVEQSPIELNFDSSPKRTERNTKTSSAVEALQHGDTTSVAHNTPHTSPSVSVVGGLLSPKKRSAPKIKMISGLGLRTDAKRVHMEKHDDSGVGHVVEVADPRPMNGDNCAPEKNSGEKTKNKKVFSKKVEDDELTMTDYILWSDNENSNSPTGVERVSQLVSDFENFEINVNGLSVDSELPFEIRKKYFDLCSDRKSLLHKCVLPNVSPKFAAEIILLTTNISGSIRNCEQKNCIENLETWVKTLEGFEKFGMDVNFIKVKLNKLVKIYWESKRAVDKEKYKDAKLEYSRVNDEIKGYESKINELKKVKRRLGDVMEDIEGVAATFKDSFRDEATAPWDC